MGYDVRTLVGKVRLVVKLVMHEMIHASIAVAVFVSIEARGALKGLVDQGVGSTRNPRPRRPRGPISGVASPSGLRGRSTVV